MRRYIDTYMHVDIYTYVAIYVYRRVLIHTSYIHYLFLVTFKLPAKYVFTYFSNVLPNQIKFLKIILKAYSFETVEYTVVCGN